MELDLFDILSEKEEGTRLYSPICGDLLLHNVSLNGVFCKQPGVKTEKNFVFMSDGHLKNYGEWADRGECLLFPNKEMRDWEKYCWKRGDVLVNKGRRTSHVIFEEFNDDTYTTFKGKHYICDYSNKEDCDDEEYYNDYHKEVNERTIEFEKDNVNNAQTYINIIEKRLGGKLNRETLEIEKQYEFKRGNIAFADYDRR